jgi:hypothetical protein
MDSSPKRSWNILNWNVRGLNSEDKCNAVRAKIEESCCSIFCIQESKLQSFDHSSMRKFAPKRFNKYALSLSVGASGGIIVGWNGSQFLGQVIFNSKYAITIQFSTTHNAKEWKLTTVYGPCAGQERCDFIQWLNSLVIDDETNWILLGDFNFYRSLENRNRDGGNMQDIITFNEVLSNLGLQEIPLNGRNFTWNNMQQEPLLEQLDWCFTSVNWITDFPNTLMLPLVKTTLDHVPCVIQIGTNIPKARIFRFETHWVDQLGFLEVVEAAWSRNPNCSNSATKITAKFKNLRKVLKKWGLGLSKLKTLIKSCNEVLSILDKLEECRPLNHPKRSFRNILKKRIAELLKNQKDYWKKRYSVRWTKLGDESTKFFHAAATERYRNNIITSLDSEDGRMVSDHSEKADLIWEDFRKRLSYSVQPKMRFDLANLMHHHSHQQIDTPFSKEDVDKVISKLPLDKAPGTDGFNGLFLRKCYHIIKEDIYKLCMDFFSERVDLQAINNSFITLVPKVNTPTNLNEFRPISLIDCVVKIITKLMGERLQSVIIPLVHQHQCGFIKTRTIQDCLA